MYHAGQEDLDNFHGKPVKEDAMEEIICHLKSLCNNKETVITSMKPPMPTTQVPSVNITNVKMSAPPQYTLLDKVSMEVVYV